MTSPVDIPSLWEQRNAPDDERTQTLAMQAMLPADLVNPAEVVGDAAWADALRRDLLTGEEDPVLRFRSRWEWDMTPQQRAAAISDTVLTREMDSFIESASSLAVKPPVDPVAFAGAVRERRAERARRAGA